MRDVPEAAGLLRIARATLLNELLPQLSGASRYEALMIANAMAIATRETDAREDAFAVDPADARQRGDGDAPAKADGNRTDDERLVQDLRAGRFDERMSEIGALLLADVRARLRISNPKYLRRAEPDNG